MEDRLAIAMIASECVPFAKTGGLADVMGALPYALARLGHDVIVVLPKYASHRTWPHRLERVLPSLGVWMGDGILEWCAVDSVATGGVRFYFIEHNTYFDREGLYDDAHHYPYLDNARRFAFLTRAALQLCKDLPFKPDVVHAHDWQTALAPAYLKVWHWNDPVLGSAASLLTIHNFGYQGKFDAAHYPYVGLQERNFTPDKFEDYGMINFLKGGIYYADVVNTVSPTYAEETRRQGQGEGLGPYLDAKGDAYRGILNGIDYEVWNPAVDPLIPARYTPDDRQGKARCKAELQRRFLLNVAADVPVIGVISRFAEQKGLHLLSEAFEGIMGTMSVQFVVLGSGEKWLEHRFSALTARYPGRVGSYIGYSEALAHWIEAGADFLLMPSLYEPCGLNQIYSLKYGTLPIVRATGGLDNTIEQYDERTGEGTGFKFWEPSPSALSDSVGWAVATYYDRRGHLEQMIRRAMRQHFSWDDSAGEYLAAYDQALARKQAL